MNCEGHAEGFELSAWQFERLKGVSFAQRRIPYNIRQANHRSPNQTVGVEAFQTDAEGLAWATAAASVVLAGGCAALLRYLRP